MTLVHCLSRYLHDNPRASDTQQGIARWWLPAGVVAPQGVLDKALAWMLEQGLVQGVPSVDGRGPYWRLASTPDVLERVRDLAAGPCQGTP